MTNTYDKNDTVRLTGTFTVSGSATNPTTVTLTVRDPSGNLDTYAASDMTNSSTGVYYKDVSIDQSGKWYYEFLGTGAVATAGENFFHVRAHRTE